MLFSSFLAPLGNMLAPELPTPDPQALRMMVQGQLVPANGGVGSPETFQGAGLPESGITFCLIVCHFRRLLLATLFPTQAIFQNRQSVSSGTIVAE